MSAQHNLPAFPRDHRYEGHNGMMLRDYFAAQALVGAMASHGSYGMGNGPGEPAERMYEIADAMLEERSR